jgi:hypothetical protein
MAARQLLFLVLAAAMLPAAANAFQPRPAVEDVQARHKKPTSVPEPTDLILFAAGVAGLIIGRCTSRSRRRDD